MSELAALYVGMNRYKTIQAIATVGLEGLALSSLFRYAKIKGNVLFFVFKHQNAKFEFGYKKEDIKTKMRGYYSTFNRELKAYDVIFNDIQAVVIAEPQEALHVKPTTLIYGERSTGNFEIACADPKLRELFASIQKTIKAERGK
ncbi:hypothetical protein [Sulfurospirillum cavolei]|uniref:hypothetical protein n=1 Tax=Sulfurospirillum cavolei TaxID=366522 RepID=UPI0005A91DD8|nr:hypothetical protein [Sulfurospirillum cavolei]